MADEPQDKMNAEFEGADTEVEMPQGPGVDELAERIQEEVNAKLAEQRELMLRAQAELQTMRRRCEADVEKAHKFALEKFSNEMLWVVDNLERALAAAPHAAADPNLVGLVEGVQLTLKGCLEIFAKFNIQQIDPRGAPFDPQQHQAMAMVPNPAVEPNTVIEVMQKGYTLNGRVLRPAMVVVSRAP